MTDSKLGVSDPRLGVPDYRHLYLHVPFCGRRCSYCDFSIAVRREVPVSEYMDAIMAELVTRNIQPPSAPLKSLYFGGGTPSKLGGEGINRLIHRLAEWSGLENLSTFLSGAEVTIEANPEDVSAEAAERWVAAGVNRVSLGVQSFDPEVLSWMHRGHGPEGAVGAVSVLRAAGVQEISIDLIFALPDHLHRNWTADLDAAISLDIEHLSVYGLTVETQTPLGRWTARGEVAEAPEERYEREFLEARERLSAAGFHHYEVSNYAKPGRRARHNSAYWTGVPYLGLGPSAHGFDGRERRWNEAAYAAWQRRVTAGEDPVEGSEDVVANAGSARAETVYLGLRTTDGLAISELASEIRPGRNADDSSVPERDTAAVDRIVQAGWGRVQDGRLVLTPQGWLRLDAIVAALI